MAKKKAAVEGEVVEPSPPEEVVEEVTEEPVEEVAEVVVAEEVVDEVVEEPTGDNDLVTIKLLMKGPIRGADGNKIHEGQEGKVVSHQADALVGRGQAEIV